MDTKTNFSAMFVEGEWPDLEYWDAHVPNMMRETCIMLIVALNDHIPFLKRNIRGRSMCLNFPNEDEVLIGWKLDLEERIPNLLAKLEQRYKRSCPPMLAGLSW